MFEQAHDEGLHRLGTGRFLDRLARLPVHRAQGAGQQADDRRGRRQPPAVPGDVLAQPVPHRLRTGQHGFDIQPAAQILGQRFDRGVTVFGPLGQRAQHDVVEIAGNRADHAPALTGLEPGAVTLQGQRRPQRVGVQDRLLPGRGGVARGPVGFAPRQQLVQHHAEGVDIGHRGDRLAAHLLGRGVVQGERTRGVAGLLGGVFLGIEQLGDAEIEQAHMAVRRDQDVRRLEVQMHDQTGVRMADGRADLQKQTDAPRHQQRALLAPLGDRGAVDVVEREIGLQVAVDARIEQMRDVRMFEAGEDLALPAEAQVQARIGEAGPQQFQGHAALVEAVRTPRQPDLAHAALAEQPVQRPRTDPGTGTQAGERRDWRVLQECAGTGVQCQKRGELVGERRVVGAQLRQGLGSRLRPEIEQPVELGRQPLPTRRVHRARQSACSEASRYIRAFCQSRRMLRSERSSSAAISSSDSPAK